MTTMLECTIQSNYVLLVCRVCVLQFLEDTNLLDTRLVPGHLFVNPSSSRESTTDVHALLTANDLDSDLLPCRTLRIPRTNDTREHALAQIRVHLVPAAVQDFSKYELVVAFGIIEVVRQSRRIHRSINLNRGRQ